MWLQRMSPHGGCAPQSSRCPATAAGPSWCHFPGLPDGNVSTCLLSSYLPSPSDVSLSTETSLHSEEWHPPHLPPVRPRSPPALPVSLFLPEEGSQSTSKLRWATWTLNPFPLGRESAPIMLSFGITHLGLSTGSISLPTSKQSHWVSPIR